MFELEQQEYASEGIKVKVVEFSSNQEVLSLIEDKKTGIFSMLDDECFLPKGTDLKLSSRMHAALEKNPRYSSTPSQRIVNEFSIAHYAGLVTYSMNSFVEKNKDEVPKGAAGILLKSRVELLRVLFAPVNGSTQSAMRHTTGPTVCMQFKGQLALLLEKIAITHPHYVRCIKPNDENRPSFFDRVRTSEQLNYGGVIEAVHVSRSGLPFRMTHTSFYNRYYCIANPFHALYKALPRSVARLSTAATPEDASKLNLMCQNLLFTLWDDDSLPQKGLSDTAVKLNNRVLKHMSQWKGKESTFALSKDAVELGKTKVFMKKEPYELFESRLARLLYVNASLIQSMMRTIFAKTKYKKQIAAVRFLVKALRKSMRIFRLKKKIEKRRILKKVVSDAKIVGENRARDAFRTQLANYWKVKAKI